MRRRDFVSLAGAAVAWPLAVRAQDAGRTYRLGYLSRLLSHDVRESAGRVPIFDELRRSGFVEGQNLVVVPGSAFGVSSEQLAELAAAIVKAAPDAILSGGDDHMRALQHATRTIPLIGMTEDMVGAGLVESLARPGGNTTGISLLSSELDGKRQELLIEAVPGARRMAALAHSSYTPPHHLEALQRDARAAGIELSIFGVSKPQEIVSAIDNAKASGAEALNVLATPLFFSNRRVVIERVATLRLPAIYQWPHMAEQGEGGLAAYGPSYFELERQEGRMVVKILRGAKPADVPVEQPVKFELVINLKTAKALDLNVPPRLLARADQVVE